ncbi:MAG: histidine phosphatase family protein [Collinsella sp.]
MTSHRVGASMSGDLYLVRHGQTMFNEKRVIQGLVRRPAHVGGRGAERSASGGTLRARESRSTMRTPPPLTRTQQTIERIVIMPYERVEDLREWGFGAFEGERVDLMPPFPGATSTFRLVGRGRWPSAPA